MRKITVRLGKRSYPIIIGAGLFKQAGWMISQAFKQRGRIAIVTDRNVGRQYALSLNRQLQKAGFAPKIITLPPGEPTKSLTVLHRLYKGFLAHRMERTSAVVALGGGVIGDIAGFAAATFMRGVNFIQIPTSLLAQVDSSVGGKVAINLPQGKNLVGAFYQPRLVLIDPLLLSTLSRPEFINGMAEVIKMAIIRSPRLVKFLRQNHQKITGLDKTSLEKMIYEALRIKTEVVERDERETGLRAVLNYGHTLGHIIERLGGYRHGFAVALGMQAAALIAYQKKLVDYHFIHQQRELLEQYGLPVRLSTNIRPSDILDRLRYDKKVQDGQVRFVLPRAIGKTMIVNNVTPEMIRKALLV